MSVAGTIVGKVVVVPGGGQGQGAAEARLLAARGAHVTAVDLGDTPVESLPGIAYRRLDVTDSVGWAALADGGVKSIRDAVFKGE
jgi:3alpha(or 20beta)-hydroxysteroid dehydrogenase